MFLSECKSTINFGEICRNLFGNKLNDYQKVLIFSLDKPELNEYFNDSNLKLNCPFIKTNGKFNSRLETSFIALVNNSSLEELRIMELIALTKQDSYIEYDLSQDQILMIDSKNEIIAKASANNDVYYGSLELEDNFTLLPGGNKLFINFMFGNFGKRCHN